MAGRGIRPHIPFLRDDYKGEGGWAAMVVAEADIQRGLRAGDRSACEALVRQYHDRIYRLLWAETGNAEDAEDLTQETFIVVWRRPDHAGGAEHLEAWLCGVALRLARSFRRRLRRRALLALGRWPQGQTTSPPDTDAAQHLGHAELLAAVQGLPAKYRHPLLLFALEGLSHREVAQALGISETTARWRVSEARKRLRRQLGEEGEEESHAVSA